MQVVLKIIKHCQEEGSAGELVQGVLLGLIQNKKLEITNCFQFPSNRAGEDDEEDEGKDAMLLFCTTVQVLCVKCSRLNLNKIVV